MGGGCPVSTVLALKTCITRILGRSTCNPCSEAARQTLKIMMAHQMVDVAMNYIIININMIQYSVNNKCHSNLLIKIPSTLQDKTSNNNANAIYKNN
jgi:hypothetical protein